MMKSALVILCAFVWVAVIMPIHGTCLLTAKVIRDIRAQNLARSSALLALLALAACADKPAPVMTDTACASFHAIRISRFDVLTPITAAQILEHNQAWAAKHCDREPPA